MATVKTAISLDRELFERLEALAEERQVSRSQLFARALEAYLREQESRRLLEQLDRAYADAPTAEEKQLSRRRRRSHRRIVEGEW